jgi:hypothetical protein
MSNCVRLISTLFGFFEIDLILLVQLLFEETHSILSFLLIVVVFPVDDGIVALPAVCRCYTYSSCPQKKHFDNDD